jgi:hypothetical protein
MGRKLLVAFVFVLALAGEPSAGPQKVDPRWNQPYQVTRLEWYVLTLNVHNTHDCDEQGLKVSFFQTPNNGINLMIFAAKNQRGIDYVQWVCIAELLVRVQTEASSGWGLPPPPISLDINAADSDGKTYYRFFYDCQLPSLAASDSGWKQGGLNLVSGRPFIDKLCHERARRARLPEPRSGPE